MIFLLYSVTHVIVNIFYGSMEINVYLNWIELNWIREGERWKLTVLLSLYLLSALTRWTFLNDVLRPEPEAVIHVRDELGYREAIGVGVVVVVDYQPVLAGAHHGLDDPCRDAGVTGEARSELDIHTAGLDVGEG